MTTKRSYRTKAIVNGYIVYHKANAGMPEMFNGGPWFFEPEGWQMNVVFSQGYPTKKAAIEAAKKCTWFVEE